MQVHVPDRPGVIAGITQALGAARINIEDFELHHFTPERGGTIEIAGRRARRPPTRAVELLDAQGYWRSRRRSPATAARERDDGPSLRGRAGGALVGELSCPATSRSRTARCCSARSATARARCDGFGAERRHARDAGGRRGARRARRAARRGPTRLRVHGVRPARPARRRTAPIDVAQRRHADAPAAGPARRPGGHVHARRRRVDPPPPRRPRGDAAARRWAPCIVDTDGCPPLHDRRRQRRCSRSATSCRSPRRRSSRACCWRASTPRARRPCRAGRRRATTPSACCAPPARASSGDGATSRSGPPSASRSSDDRRARRHLARPRRSSSPPRCCPSRACSCAACRRTPTRTGLLTVLERMGARITALQPPHDRRRRAGRRCRGAIRPSSSPREIEPEIVPSPDRRAAADRARGLPGARPHRRARRGGAAREGVEPPRDVGRAAARGRRARARDPRRLGDPGRARAPARRPRRRARRPPHRDARRDRRPRLAGRRRVEGAGPIGVSYPGFAAELERLAVR